MALKLITPSTVANALDLTEAKLHLKVDGSDDDFLIQTMVGSACEMVEQLTGRALLEQTWELSLDSFPTYFELTRIPLQEITSIKYTDSAGVVQTMQSTDYTVSDDDFDFAKVYPAYGTTWPSSRGDVGNVKVRFVSGYADAASIPESLRSWMKLSVGAQYENREAEVIERGSVLTLGFADRLLDRYKVWRL